ncbi:hypothetical protein K440DRAFT_642285 [Wilcoxina mikolae CBS 423.85]|nr:hypothetical protein K440DRAFT_642285 [Wilcoxina mikolae CBS 423.85]
MAKTSRIAFTSIIAIVVTLTGTRSWKIVRYTVHQSRPHHIPRDAMIREQETNLRVAESDMGTLLQMCGILWRWRHFGELSRDDILKRSRRSTWTVLLLALAHTVLFLSLGILIPIFVSSQNGYPVVLANSNYCTMWVENTGHAKLELASNRAARSYYQNCYSTDLSLMECNYLVKQKIALKQRDEKCPFQPQACMNGMNATSFDTGPLRAGFFGVNSAWGNTMSFRRKTTCVPLNQTLYTYNLSYDGIDTLSIYNFSTVTRDNAGDWSRNRNLFSIMPSNHWATIFSQRGYLIDTCGNSVLDHQNIHPSLARPDADLTILLIQKDAVVFDETIDDPLFSAHNPITFGNHSGEPYQGFTSDTKVGMIACLDQIEVCNTAAGICLGFLPKLNKDQLDILAYMWYALERSDLRRVIQLAGPEILVVGISKNFTNWLKKPKYTPCTSSSATTSNFLHESLRAGTWIPSGIRSIPVAYGTLGVPTLVRQNGSEWRAMFTADASTDLPREVNRMSVYSSRLKYSVRLRGVKFAVPVFGAVWKKRPSNWSWLKTPMQMMLVKNGTFKLTT